MTTKKRLGIGILALTALGLTACGGTSEAPPSPPPREEPAPAAEPPAREIPKRIEVRLEPKSGSSVAGTATFTGNGGQVDLEVNVENLAAGTHAIHIHAVGDCSAEDATSAGDHWNPMHAQHGKWDSDPFHLGDIGNIEAGADGKGSLHLSTDKWEIGTGGMHDIVGHSVVVHEKADDFTSQPAGAAGARIACGVIEAP